MNDHLEQSKSSEDMPNQARRWTAPRVAPFARFFLGGVLILGLSFVAEAGLFQKDPNGGIFGTGFKMWGINGTARVLIEYKAKASNEGLLLEPVNEKKDRYGFVYAPMRNSHDVYNPFKSASAYRK